MPPAERWLSVRPGVPGWGPTGDEVGPVRESAPGFAQGRSRLVFLVHGYNDTEDDARKNFQQLTDELRDLGPRTNGILADLGYTYWPGNWILGPLSGISYPFEIRKAVESGTNFGLYLAHLAGPAGTPTQVYLVAHSLGCRVVLEILGTLDAAAGGSLVVSGTCFMAAAIPVDMAEERWARIVGIARPATASVLYSTADTILHFFFPIGETLAGEGFFPTAVGRFGQPDGVWNRRDDLTPDGHGAYWSDPRAARTVARLLGVPVPSDPPRSEIPDRALAEPAPIATRTLDERQLRARDVFAP